VQNGRARRTRIRARLLCTRYLRTQLSRSCRLRYVRFGRHVGTFLAPTCRPKRTGFWIPPARPAEVVGIAAPRRKVAHSTYFVWHGPARVTEIPSKIELCPLATQEGIFVGGIGILAGGSALHRRFLLQMWTRVPGAAHRTVDEMVVPVRPSQQKVVASVFFDVRVATRKCASVRTYRCGSL
jgi:hypothetical protein